MYFHSRAGLTIQANEAPRWVAKRPGGGGCLSYRNVLGKEILSKILGKHRDNLAIYQLADISYIQGDMPKNLLILTEEPGQIGAAVKEKEGKKQYTLTQDFFQPFFISSAY